MTHGKSKKRRIREILETDTDVKKLSTSSTFTWAIVQSFCLRRNDFVVAGSLVDVGWNITAVQILLGTGEEFKGPSGARDSRQNVELGTRHD